MTEDLTKELEELWDEITGNEIVKKTDIHLDWEQIRQGTTRHYETNQNIRILISPKDTIKGKNLGRIGQHKEKYEIARIYKKNVKIPQLKGASALLATAYKKETLQALGDMSQMLKESSEYLILFDQFENQKYGRIKERAHYFADCYLFLGENRQKFFIISPDDLKVGEHILKGTIVDVPAKIRISSGINTPILQSYFLLHTAEPRYKSFTKEDVESYLKKTSLEQIKKHIFNCYKHPKQFENLALAWLFSGKYNNYPLHFLWIGAADSGQSTFQERVNKVLLEALPVMDSGTSTLKGLIPSHATSPPSHGHFLQCQRVCNVDEFFDLINTVYSSYGGDTMRAQTQLDKLKSLLEHKNNLARSGNGVIETHPTAKALFTTNDKIGKKELDGIDGLTDILPSPFLSRMLIYFQRKEHKEHIHDNRKAKHEEIESDLDEYQFLALYDYFQSHTIAFDTGMRKRIKETQKRLFEWVKYNTGERSQLLFNDRREHHLMLVLDGLVKLRCLNEQKLDFKVRDSDYVLLFDVMEYSLRGWSFSNIGSEINVTT